MGMEVSGLASFIEEYAVIENRSISHGQQVAWPVALPSASTALLMSRTENSTPDTANF
jgi:hypothetical protein